MHLHRWNRCTERCVARPTGGEKAVLAAGLAGRPGLAWLPVSWLSPFIHYVRCELRCVCDRAVVAAATLPAQAYRGAVLVKIAFLSYTHAVLYLFKLLLNLFVT